MIEPNQIRYKLKGMAFNQPVSFYLAKEYFSQKEQLHEVLECPICLEVINCVNCFCLLVCGHSYHIGCIMSQTCCALCRK